MAKNTCLVADTSSTRWLGSRRIWSCSRGGCVWMTLKRNPRFPLTWLPACPRHSKHLWVGGKRCARVDVKGCKKHCESPHSSIHCDPSTILHVLPDSHSAMDCAWCVCLIIAVFTQNWPYRRFKKLKNKNTQHSLSYPTTTTDRDVSSVPARSLVKASVSQPTPWLVSTLFGVGALPADWWEGRVDPGRPLTPVTVFSSARLAGLSGAHAFRRRQGSSRAQLVRPILCCPVVSSSSFIPAPVGLGSPESSWRKDGRVVNEIVLYSSHLGKLRKEKVNRQPTFSFSVFVFFF